MTASLRPHVRCAIYTRKSSEEGLEQSFNSLQAQREACEAFIASQRHEGWHMIQTPYDDGGFSGGTLDRPALKRLLDKIAASKKKGMWMGGTVPPGYDVKERKLVVDPRYARIVQGIFTQYLRLG